MKSNFTVTCPHCNEVNDFTSDNWHDELIDDSTDHYIPCMFCGNEMCIQVVAVYNLIAEIPEDWSGEE